MTTTKDDGTVEAPRAIVAPAVRVRIHDVAPPCLRPESIPWRRKNIFVPHRLSLSHLDVETKGAWPSIPDAELDAAKAARVYCQSGPLAYVGSGRFPYNLLVLPSGTIEQCLPLSAVGAHASGGNRKGVGVATVGLDGECTPEQWRSLVWLAKLLGLVNLLGHSPGPHGDKTLHLAGASKDPDKTCPGPVLDMGRLVLDVGVRRAGAVEEIEAAGLVV